jgi:hypothetical protein
MRKLTFAATFGAAVLATSVAHAFPLSAPPRSPAGGVIKVRDGCGVGWHRGAWGVCRPNAAAYAYGPYVDYGPRPRERCWWQRTPWGPRWVCAW